MVMYARYSLEHQDSNGPFFLYIADTDENRASIAAFDEDLQLLNNNDNGGLYDCWVHSHESISDADLKAVMHHSVRSDESHEVVPHFAWLCSINETDEERAERWANNCYEGELKYYGA